MKKIVFLLAAGVLVVGYIWFVYTPENNNLVVTFLNIGQGDSTIIRTSQGETILIDGGPDRTILSKLAKYIPWAERTIDLMILSHPHADHLTGLNYVLERYKVRHVLMTDAVHTTPEYFRFLELLKEKNIPITLATTGKKFMFSDGVVIEVIWPNETFVDRKLSDLNDSSIVDKLVYGSSSIIFTGDTPAANEQAILRAGLDVRAQILKVAHQGSKTSSTKEFIQAVAPEVAIIPVGPNSYGHPHKEVVDRLNELVPLVLRTDEEGDITFVSNGQTFTRAKRNLIFPWFVVP